MKATRTISNPGERMIYSVPVRINGDTYTVQSSVSMYQSAVEGYLWALHDGFKPPPLRARWWELQYGKSHAPELQTALELFRAEELERTREDAKKSGINLTAKIT